MSSNWPSVKLTEVCSPKQWPTVPKTDFTKEGYPVFGANGQIGFYKDYNHEHETVLVTCRGATCGSINICPPRSYVTGNAMALDNLNTARIDMMFLYHLLKKRGFADVISGSAQPQITRQGLDSVKFDLPPIEEQRRIAAILDKADAIRRKREQALALADDFLRVTFLDMFGDPMTNPKGWATAPLGGSVKSIESGWSAKGENRKAEQGEKGVLKISAVTSGHYLPSENKFVEKIPARKKLIFPQKGDLLFSRANTRELVAATCIVETNNESTFLPDKLWRINVRKEFITTEYLKCLLSHAQVRSRLCQNATGTSGSMLNIAQKKLLEFEVPIPEIGLQKKFSVLFWMHSKLREKLEKIQSMNKSKIQSLSQRAFSGDL